MPPEARFTKEQIIKAGLALVRERGLDALTARAVSARLGASTKPIFMLFENMEEVHAAVLAAADRLYQSFIAQDMAAGIYPPYKASGMAYIRFARQERQLFKLLFMRDRSGEHISEDRVSIQPLLNLIQQNLGISEDDAYRLHLQLWVFIHGIAAMIATDYLPWDTEFISRSLTDVYQGLAAKYKGDTYGCH